MSTTRSAAGPVAGAVTGTGRRRPGAALFVIAAAQLMVVLDPHPQGRPETIGQIIGIAT